MTDLCVYLDWDSDFFGRRIARVTVNRLDIEQTEQVIAWCTEQRIECLYFLAEANAAETIRAVEQHGFAFEDIRLTLARRGALPEQPAGIRLSRPDDVPALKAIAGVSHRDSRFYFDGHFTQAECDALYETWIEQSCAGYSDAVLVAERNGQPVGYMTCTVQGETGNLGLLGVDEQMQGQGIGTALINGSLAWLGSRGVMTVELATQGRNMRAQRAFQRLGFVSDHIELWYHRWFEASEQKP
ncbi:MAG: GNAT family N-acetyltransferase [Chloroflexota bacterium]